MAVSPRASGFGAITQASGISLAVTKPAGVVDGDMLVLWYQSDSGSLYSSGLTGWTQEATATVDGLRAYLFWKIAASEPASWTITQATANIYGAIIGAYSGADQATQPDVTTQTGTAINTVTDDAPATLSTPSAGCYELALYQDSTSINNFATPSGFTDRQGSSNYAQLSIHLFDNGPLTPSGVLPTVSSTVTTQAAWAATHFVIRAAAATQIPYQPWLQRAPILAQ